MTGEPFQVNSGQFTNNASHVSRADVLDPTVRARLQEVPGVTGPVVFLNNQAFAIPAPGSNGSGRNIFRGPSYWNVDLGIVKLFDITERFKLQFRTEMFNAFNRTVLGGPATNVSDPFNFGKVTSQANGPRTAQFAMKLNY